MPDNPATELTTPRSRVGQSQGPRLDALDDALVRQRIRAELFGSEPVAVRIDRFEVQRELGRGGMGVVYAAYDGQLERKVAIKVLHAEASSDGAARTRLLREAQALARLSHPHVVQVHEAGVHEGRVYLVMELVQGRTLRQWLEEEAPRAGRGRWRAVLDVLVSAGEGLAAAHEAGLTHRDFKPDNVLVGNDGRVRVVDFGLATVDTSGVETIHSQEEGTDSRPQERLTRTGAAVGTVAYMPLEQVRGGKVDARADQFSFCVTLYEALFGQRPYASTSRAALVLALERGEPALPTGITTVPRWLRSAVWRGLSPAPADRFEDMRALLRALTVRLRQRRIGMLSAAAVLAVGIGVGMSVAGGEPEVAEPCAAAGGAIDETWNDEQAKRLETALEPGALTLASAAIDQWSEDWRATASMACEQVYVEQIASEDALDARGRCLEEQRHRLGSMLRVLEAEGSEGSAVFDALAVLETPSDCLLDRNDPHAGLTDAQLQDERRLSERLMVLDVAQGDRSVEHRREQVRQVYEDAERKGLDVVVARAALVGGRLAMLASDREATEQWLGRAIDIGTRLELSPITVPAWLLTAESALYFDLEAERARWIWERAYASIDGLRRPHELHARSRITQGRILMARNDTTGASGVLEEAIDELKMIGPRVELYRVEALRMRAMVADRGGDGPLAVALYAEAREREQLVTAAQHPGSPLGTKRFDEGMALLRSGELAAASEALQQARTQLTRELPRSRRLARVHLGLSAVADATGDFESARSHAVVADAILRELGGELEPERADAVTAIGTAAFRTDRFDDAAGAFELALRIAERSSEPNPVYLAFYAMNLAEARLGQGRLRDAERLLGEAVEVLEAKLGPEHPDLAIAYKIRGALALQQGRVPAAETDLRRALALHETSGGGSVEAAETRRLLARALESKTTRSQPME